MTFSPDEADNKVIILPLKNGADIDWTFLNTINRFKNSKLEPVSDDDRTNFQFNEEKYRDAVVMPWYRNQVKTVVVVLWTK
jgi:endoribonuclease Dicer